MSIDVEVHTEETREGVTFETRLYSDDYATLTVLDTFGFQVSHLEGTWFAGEAILELHDRLVDTYNEGRSWE